MAEKIKNLGLAVTEDQQQNAWSKVMARKSKMLEASDWTQLNDIFLSPEDRKIWIDWRAKLRKVKKEGYHSPEEVIPALDALERAMPVDTKFVDVDHSKKRDIITSANAVTEKIYVKEQPVIIEHKLSFEDFKTKFIELLDANPQQMQDYLKTIMLMDDLVIFYDFDCLEEAKSKTLKYLNTRQKEIIVDKLKDLDSREILIEKTEEALDYLSAKTPAITDYPLIDLHSQLLKLSPEDVAIDFIENKKNYNKILLDAEKFLLYTSHRIDICDTLINLKELVEEIKNGY